MQLARGMFGIGGIIAIPVLALAFDMDQQLAQGGDIASARASTPALDLRCRLGHSEWLVRADG